MAYVDPFIRDVGRRRWDEYAERFSAALTLYEMATGTLPAWVAAEGLSRLNESRCHGHPAQQARFVLFLLLTGTALSTIMVAYPKTRRHDCFKRAYVARRAVLGTLG